MYASIAMDALDLGRLMPVTAEADIEHLVKESEMLTGQPGRRFLVAGAERLAYHVEWLRIGYRIQRLAEDSRPASTIFLPCKELSEHTLGNALRCGQLFTPALH